MATVLQATRSAADVHGRGSGLQSVVSRPAVVGIQGVVDEREGCLGSPSG